MADTHHPRSATDSQLAALGITVLERGWLSANNVVMRADTGSLVVDTGYATHAEQTVALIHEALEGCPL
jgi:glyoxylase-like metal-dependent hydrolase (beta-lactamase superfamily II)